MPKMFRFKITVKGEGSDVVKSAFDEVVTPFEFYGVYSEDIFTWDFPDVDEFLAFGPKYGDGITVSSESVIIKGGCNGQPPHDLVERLSKQYPPFVFELESYEWLSRLFQRWHYERGEGVLWDCARWNAFEIEADDGYEAIYMHNGEQLADMPGCPLSSERKAALDAERTLFEQVTGESLHLSIDRIMFGTDSA